ncbi:cytosolic regulator of adenylyl cyclase [Dictyostelium purpureum]|uniref:Cytosolic regulator of adenylyl cyclase n=1 Tax=Dictyostelium purpureum TaxID=5786 RepID=F0ZA44_DICPU|nr:cytosolic regulator of adenylyl cyclase [Dictyostelium purpureum]EGC39137.1 cytosolic regulator of adenylyl cyclase [Dictyostelium purpureum]|eukprot:XP_003284283.1 cytosolic regulator of adenylyl cyclase [Dictyostelium purpureum]
MTYSDSNGKVSPPHPSNAELKKQLLESLQCLDEKSLTLKIKLDHINKMVELKKFIPDLSKIDLNEYTIFKKYTFTYYFIKFTNLRQFIALPPKTIRTAGLRAIRYYLSNSQSIKDLLELKVHFFITRSLERDKHSESERIQALKIIRTIMEIDCSLMPHCFVKALVALSENQEDGFCRVSLECLTEISIRNPQISSHCGGIRTIFDAVLDPFYQGIQESLLICILYLLSDKNTRCYIRPKSDLEIILSPLTNSFNIGIKVKGGNKEKEKEKEKEDEIAMKRWTASSKAVLTLIKSWIGLISLTSDDQGLKSIVDSLRMPQIELQEKGLDSIFEIFRVQLPKSISETFGPQKPTQTFNFGSETLQDLPSRTRSLRHNLLNNYLSVLLIAFINNGLIEGLVYLGNYVNRDGIESEKERSRNISLKSTVLLAELLHMSNQLLPTSQCAKLQTLPSLVNSAISFRLDPRLRSSSNTMVTNLHSYSHNKSTTTLMDSTLAIGLTGANKWRRIKGQDRRLDKVDDVKMKMDWHMDEAQFQQKIKDTQVLVTKDFQKWNWELMFELLEGPLNNPQHLAGTLKTKFIKRMLSFLRPNKKLFSTMAWTTENLKYVRTACVCLEVLIAHEIGFDFLKDNKTIIQIADMLKLELDFSTGKIKENDKQNSNRLLNPEKVLKTMSREYFTMLGTLSSNLLGLEILARNNIFDYIKPLAELPGRDDLSHLIMTSLDYNVNGASRTILQKILTSNSRVVRYLATKYLRFLLRSGVQDFSNWGIELLVQQLNDTDTKVSGLSLNVLDEACDDQLCLEELIDLKPNLLKLGKQGKSLLLRFLSSPKGLESLLQNNNFVEQEEQLWINSENAAYVIAMETKTEKGCQIIKKSDNFNRFIQVLNDPSAKQLDKRAALIAIGHIGSSQDGFSAFIKQDSNNSIISLLIDISEKSPCLSLRSTCFYALGMISCIEEAQPIFNQFGWESPQDLNSRILLPKDFKKSLFLTVPTYDYLGSWADHSFETLPANYFNDPIKNEIITFVGNLSSHITAEGASKNLKRLKVKYPDHFASGEMLHAVLNLLNTFKYRLGARRFIYDLFDIAIFSSLEPYHDL